ncbi:MaoC family dehydratase [Maricurvus nonylphenolicus]|uniref:MaoC family dehydratase n=1 Tax=Maricurvus nonylphenolicus TaxID=1008307 RepID=UPI0036F1CD40
MNAVKSHELPSLVGHQSEPSEWFEVTQEQVNQFADTTLDHQFIHVDPVKAAETPFGGTIAHGMLTLSLIAHFAESFSVKVDGMKMGLNYGFNKIRFLNPVKMGARIRAQASITEVDEKAPGQHLLTYSVTVEIEGENTPAMIAEWLCLVIA